MTRQRGLAWRCNRCGGPTRVLASRAFPARITRRRACDDCGFRISTEEVIVTEKPTTYGRVPNAYDGNQTVSPPLDS